MTSLQEKLLAAFEEEHKEHLELIRAALIQFTGQGEQVARIALDDAFRGAHTLKGAARVVEFKEVMQLAHDLETLFARMRQGEVSHTPELARSISNVLSAIEDSVAARNKGVMSAAGEAALSTLEGVLGTPTPRPAKETATEVIITPPSDFSPKAPAAVLRVSVDHLDQLLGTTSELIAGNRAHEQTKRDADMICKHLATVNKDCAFLRQQASIALRRLAKMPEMGPVRRYIAYIEDEMSSLSNHFKRLRDVHRRNCHTHGILIDQLQTDAQKTRMMPAHNVYEGFPKMMRDLAGDLNKKVDFEVSGLDIEADRMILQALKAPLMHILRNAMAHGLEDSDERVRAGKSAVGMVRMRIQAVAGRLVIEVRDDGSGVDLARLKDVAMKSGRITEAELSSLSDADITQLVFLPGLSTASTVNDVSGRGMGLSVVFETVSRFQGDIKLVSEAGRGSTFELSLPLALSSHRLLSVSVNSQIYCIPSYGVSYLQIISRRRIINVEGRPTVFFRKKPVALVSLASLLKTDESKTAQPPAAKDHVHLVILKSGNKRLAVVVDDFLSERVAIVKALRPPLDRLRKFDGAIHLDDGSVALVLNPLALMEASPRTDASDLAARYQSERPVKRHRILVVDDSFTTRLLEKSILEAKGYDVVLAVDGNDALVKVGKEDFDLIISDVEMPHMDGFTLLKTLKEKPAHAHIPVIIVTSLEKTVDRQRGLDLGAEAYLPKQKFDQGQLLETIEQIL